MAVTRQRVRVALGALWILDGVLQLQRSMFTHTFANQVLAPAGQGQPWFVAQPVALTARLVGEHPLPWDAAFAAIQLCLGIGLMIPRFVRPALLASVAWSCGVWWLGEGLGGIAGGHADLLTGAPGAVVLYAGLACAVWPRPDASGLEHRPLPGVLAFAWAALWAGGAVLRLLPGQASSDAIVAEIKASSVGAPGWLQHVDGSVSTAVASAGTGLVVVWTLGCLLIGLGGLATGAVRRIACGAGILFAGAFWVTGQAFGQPWTGTATDPNSGPLIVLMALAVMAVGAPAPRCGRHRRAAATVRWRLSPSSPASTRTVPTLPPGAVAPVGAWATPELWRSEPPAYAGQATSAGWRPPIDAPGAPGADRELEPVG